MVPNRTSYHLDGLPDGIFEALPAWRWSAELNSLTRLRQDSVIRSARLESEVELDRLLFLTSWVPIFSLQLLTWERSRLECYLSKHRRSRDRFNKGAAVLIPKSGKRAEITDVLNASRVSAKQRSCRWRRGVLWSQSLPCSEPYFQESPLTPPKENINHRWLKKKDQTIDN